MEKEKFMIPKKVSLLVFFILSITYNSTFSQTCTNPTPIGDTSQVFCKTDNKTIDDLIATTTPTGGTIVWYDAPSGGVLYGGSDILIDGNTYYADDISGNNCSDPRLPVKVTIYGDFPTNVDVLVGKCAIDKPTIGDLSATGQNIAWYDAQTSGNFLDSSVLLEDGKTYWVQQTENGCISDRLPTTVSLIDPITPTTSLTQSFCYQPTSNRPSIGDLQPSGATVLWYASKESLIPLKNSDLLIDGEDYWVAAISFPCVSTIRKQTSVVLEAAPNAGTDGSYPVCEINLVNTNLFSLLGGTPDAGGTWTAPDGSAHSETFIANTDVAGIYTYTVAGSTICPDDSATVTITITVIPAPTTTEANQSFCEIDAKNVADLNATGTGILWYDTEISTTPLNGTDLLADGDYWASQTDGTGCESATRLVVNVTITKPLPPTTTETNQTFCEIDAKTVADLNATGTGILWYDTETSTTPLNGTDLLADGDYWASQTDGTGCESATRLVVNVTITKPLPPTTTETNQTFCEIDAKTVADLNATGTGILWYDTEISTTPLNGTDLLADGDYWASQTDGTGCESTTRLVVNVTITKPLPPTTTEANQTFCEIDAKTVADLNATGTGILWYDTEISTTPLNGTNLLADGDYWASQTDGTGCESATRLVVNVTITKPLPPTITETNQAFCEIDAKAVADLNATGTGILWYDTETSATPLNKTDLLSDGDYWASQTDGTGCESATRLVVNVTITKPLPPTITETNQAFCEIDAKTVADLNATGTGILWYDTETSATPLNGTDLLADGDYWASQTDGTGCESTTRLVVNVTILNSLSPTTTEANQTFCEIEAKTVADLNVIGTGILWYDTEISTTPLNGTDLLSDGDYWASQTETSSNCESASRLVVNVSITKPLPPTIAATIQSFCMKDYLAANPTIAELDAIGNNIVWYDTAISTTPLATTDILIDGKNYFASQTDALSGCESAARLAITVSLINPTTPSTSQTNQSFCKVDNPTISNLNVVGTTIIWYADETTTTALSSSESLINGEDYWAAASDATTGCESIARIGITVTINDALPPTISTITQRFCASSSPKISDLNVSGNGIVWYASETDNTPINLTELLVDSEDYWAAQTNPSTGCISSMRKVANVILTDPGTPAIISLGNEFCKIDKPTLADLDINVSANSGGTISWYDSYPNGNLLSASTTLVEGETYYAIETTVNDCKSINPLAVIVSLEACDAYEVEIYDGFSPSGNGVNDTFKLGNLRDLYPNFKVEFFNRWGTLVYTANASKPDWDGRLNGDGELVPAGVYYFIINFNKNDRKPIQRRLYLSR